MTDVYVLQVFTDESGEFGDEAPVIFDEDHQISSEERQNIARDLDAVETVFINNEEARQVSFVHGQGELDFAGVPAIGVAWLLSERAGTPISSLVGRGGKIEVSHADGLTWARAELETMPPWHHVQLADADAVESIALSETVDWEHRMVWAWADEDAGLVRARTFASDWDIPEAMGNGSGSLLLAAMLGRAIEVKHGEGSVIYARPAGNGFADLGGRVHQAKVLVV